MNIFSKLFRFFAVSFGKHNFIFLFNLRAFLKGNDTRVSYRSDLSFFLAKDSKHQQYFQAKLQNYNCFNNGLSYRANKIGEDYFLSLIEFKPKDLVIDCGANIGDLKLYFEENKIEVDYVGIEPSKSEYNCLIKNIYPSSAYNLALWSANETIDFYISSDNADSSIFMPRRYIKKVSIKAIRLDDIIFNPIKLLKLEAEGAEMDVLIGAQKILSKIEYISADLGCEKGIEESSPFVEVKDWLIENNFYLVQYNSLRMTALFHNSEYINS